MNPENNDLAPVPCEQRFRSAFAHAAIGMAITDIAGKFVQVNPAFCRLTGLSQPELLAADFESIVHPDDLPKRRQLCEQMVAGEIDSFVIEKRLLNRGGGEVWVRDSVSMARVEGGLSQIIVFSEDITQRKQAEEALRTSEERFRIAAENASDTIYEWDLQTGQVGIFGVVQDRLGDLPMPRDVEAWKSIVHPEDLESELARIYQHIESGERYSGGYRVPGQGGRIYYYSNRGQVLRNAAGDAYKWVGLATDITERKKAEEDLRASEERFRIASENASDIVYECDLRTGKVETFGTNSNQFGDKPVPQDMEGFARIVHPGDRERVLAVLRNQIEAGERYCCEYRVLGKSGRIYYYSDRGQAIRDAAGESYKWIGVVTDITERKLAEEGLAQLAAIVQCSEDAIVGTNLWGDITSWNGGAEKLYGYPAAEVVGKSLSILLPAADPDAAGHPALLETIMRGDVNRIEETVFVRKDGGEVQVSLTVSPILNTSGETVGIATIARDVSARRKAEQELARQARHDHLTGLPNRLLLTDRLAEAIRSASSAGLMAGLIYVDLDGFKYVNDTLGHETGDALLQQITARLSRRVRGGDTLARMGGDEFMLTVAQMRDTQTALSVAGRLAEALQQPFSVDGHELYITASMGISVYPQDGMDASTLQRNADAAMYEAKHGGKDRIRYFTPEMRTSVVDRLELENELRRAMDRGELSLYFQPIFTALGNRQTAYEALLRWFHPARGFIPPARFIPLAEETGLILRLGSWVLQEACRQCRLWQDRGLASVRVSVNVSALEFDRTDYVENVLRVLDEAGLDGHLLALEVTESLLMRDVEDSIRKMSRLRERGIRISVDDFGTGYSSLGYLPKMPIDTLKIDRCFVAGIGADPAADSLIAGMISLGHSMGKRVVVEGIETREQLEVLRKIGCDEVQGFLLGRPAMLPARYAAELAALERGLISAPDSQIAVSEP